MYLKIVMLDLKALNSSERQLSQQNDTQNEEQLKEFVLLVELRLLFLTVLSDVFAPSLEYNYLYCMILGRFILLFLLIVLQDSNYISIPTDGIIVAFTMCDECLVIIDEQKYKVNNICLSLRDLEIILVMDWSAANRILIDCDLGCIFIY